MKRVFDIRTYGADPDGAGDATAAIGTAPGELRASGGGILLVPPGRFLSGPLELGDGTELRLEKGAVLRFVDDFDRYPPVRTRWEGLRCHAMHPLVFAHGARDVSIRGEGTLDGAGGAWWEAYRTKREAGQTGPLTPGELALAALNGATTRQPSGGGGRELQFLRPPLVQFLSCESVCVTGVTLVDSPFWTLHAVHSRGVRIEGVTIRNPPDAPNTDGIDIDSCADVAILDSTVDVGDDCIALKSGSGTGDAAERNPTTGVRIRGCTFLRGHGGIVVGSETAGGVDDVEVRDCRFRGTDRGVRIKSRRGRGGAIRSLRFLDLDMDGVLTPLTINFYYKCGAAESEARRLFSLLPEPVESLTPSCGDILVRGLRARGCRASAGFIVGLPESRILDLVLENCAIELAPGSEVPPAESEMYQGLPETAERGIRMRHADCRLDGVVVAGCGEKMFVVEEGCTLSGSSYSSWDGSSGV